MGWRDAVKRWITPQTLIAAVIALELLFTSGVVYGWAPLSIALTREGAYHNLCANPEVCA